MSRHLDIDDIKRRAEDTHMTAKELDLLVASARELSARRERELNQLNNLLDDLENRLSDMFEKE